jgi:hypothetical protein
MCSGLALSGSVDDAEVGVVEVVRPPPPMPVEEDHRVPADPRQAPHNRHPHDMPSPARVPAGEDLDPVAALREPDQLLAAAAVDRRQPPTALVRGPMVIAHD